jgi:hypothetical protein
MPKDDLSLSLSSLEKLFAIGEMPNSRSDQTNETAKRPNGCLGIGELL